MKHDLVGQLRRVVCIALTPVIGNCVGKNGASTVEVCGTDCASDLRIAFESVLGVLVPEMERAVTASSAECAMNWVE